MSSDCVVINKRPVLNVGEFVAAYFAERGWLTAGYTLAMLAFPLGTVLIPAVTGSIIEKIKSRTRFVFWWRLVVLFAIFNIVRLVAHVGWFYLDVYLVADLQAHARRKVFTEVLEAYAYKYKAIKTSSVIAKSIKLPTALFELVREWHRLIIPGLMTVLAIAFYTMFALKSKVIGGWILGFVVIMAIGMWASSVVAIDGMIAADYQNDRIQEKIGDVLDNVLSIYLADGAKEEVDELDELHCEHVTTASESRNIANHFMAMIKLAMFVVVIIIGYKVYTMYVDPKNTAIGDAELTSFVFVLMCSAHVLFNALDSWPRLLYQTALVHKMSDYVNQLIDCAGDRKVSGPTITVRPDVPAVEFAGVEFSYSSQDEPTLSGATFSIMPGQRVLIQGGIGSGKSTIALMMNGLGSYSAGRAMLFGESIDCLTREEIKKAVTFIPQHPQLLDSTIYKNLALGTDLTIDQVQQKLDDLGVSFPFPLTYPVGKNGSQLSTGQRVKVYVMRAALRNTPIIVCDEVIANLDADSEADILTLLDQILQAKVENGRVVEPAKTLLFITHSVCIDMQFDFKLNVIRYDPSNPNFKSIQVVDHVIPACRMPNRN